jgi:hypothetical protein
MRQILTNKFGTIILTLAALLLLVSSTSAGGGTAIYPYVIGGGGGHSQAGVYTLDATIGQAVAGRVVSPPYDLCAGFWCGMGRYKVYLPLVLRNYP